jgi:hypothetical protein
MYLRNFILLQETLLRIINENYNDLNSTQQYKVSMNLQNTLIKNYINDNARIGTREETNNLIMQWIEENAAQFRHDIIAGDYDYVVKKFL